VQHCYRDAFYQAFHDPHHCCRGLIDAQQWAKQETNHGVSPHIPQCHAINTYIA